MNRLTLLTAFAFAAAGCSQQPTEQPVPAENVSVVITPPQATGQTPEPLPSGEKNDKRAEPSPVSVPVAQPPKAPEPPTMFEYPADLGGKVVAKAVSPDRPALTPAERFGVAPKPRATPARIADPDALVKSDYRLPPLPVGKPAEVRPTAPPERVPVDLGFGTADVPARPTFPIAAGITTRAPDVKLPPAMPTLGRLVTERVSLDDPTAEVANTVIATSSVKTTLGLAGFLKVTLPDPFELGEQIKPKVPAAIDPGLVPVVVNPQRVK